MALVLLFTQKAISDGDGSAMQKDHIKGIIGAIVDYNSRIGKEEKVAMELAREDIYGYNNQSLVLHIKNSQRDPFQAALADLINTQQVEAIVGAQTWEEASLVAEICSQARIPILSFADATPQWATERWPFLYQASPNQYAQMKAVAAIVQSWEWYRVTVIYEDTESVATGVIPPLSDALREVGAEINQLVALPPFTSSSLSEELEKLKRGQCRVFVVHLSLPLALHLFKLAKEMEMMKDYVWITTDPITSLVHSINASSIDSMQGILGVKSYYPETGDHFHDFYHRFRQRFSSEYPKEDNHEPGKYAVQAYDAIRTIALAMGESNMGGSKKLLQKIFSSDFQGLSTKIQFTDRKLSPARIFQIINVMGKSYRELGFWSEGLGFSERIDKRATYDNSSMKTLGQILWPGGPLYTPRGWTVLKIGVPTGSTFKQFVDIVYDDHSENKTSFSGFSIEVFKATLENLPFDLPHKLIPFYGTYDQIVEEVHLKKFDAVVGDVAIVANRFQHAEFTQPYTDAGLVMIVPIRSRESNKAWLFMKPFTRAMWLLVVIINVYNGFVVWLIERNHCPNLSGPISNQVGTLLWLAFSTLFSLQGGGLHSNLTRMTMVVWLFVVLVITQSYTANLTSMLTVQKLEPTVADVESLLYTNAMVGYCKGSYVRAYLETVIGFKRQNIKNFTLPEEFAQALRSREIEAVFLEAPLAKLFLAKYCKGFIAAGPRYKIGGFGFVFPRGSPLLPGVSKALLKVSESGKLRDLENSMLASETCSEVESNDENYRLSPNSFWALFIITGGTSTVTLVIYVFCHRWNVHDSTHEHKTIWRLMLAVMKYWGYRKRRFSRRVSDTASPRSSPNASDSWVQV
ncbi:hypothetical protein L1049_027222 [Liquidambar formosana]|uniref:Glutamate receptor n=1 Tax=Liquidambar formosana TaxID=63359 RepID=A0AAP0N0U3_LIQFO